MAHQALRLAPRFAGLRGLMHGDKGEAPKADIVVKPRQTAATPQVARATTTTTTSAAPATFSALALNMAVQAERDAVARLFAHPGAKARVGMLCTRLASGAPASSLRAEIDAGKIRTDQELREIVAETVQANASDVWDRALGKARPAATVAERAWEGAISNITPATARA